MKPREGCTYKFNITERRGAKTRTEDELLGYVWFPAANRTFLANTRTKMALMFSMVEIISNYLKVCSL